MTLTLVQADPPPIQTETFWLLLLPAPSAKWVIHVSSYVKLGTFLELTF